MSRSADASAADLDPRPSKHVDESRLVWEMFCGQCGDGRGAVLAWCTIEFQPNLGLCAVAHNKDRPGHAAVVRPRKQRAVPTWLAP